MVTTAPGIELIAEDLLRAAGLAGCAVDAYELALWAGYDVRVGCRPGMRACLLGRTVIVSPGDPPERQRFAVAHELAHEVLRDCAMVDDELTADELAAAMLLPRTWFLARLAECGADIATLRASACVYSSHEAIGRRIVSLGRAVMWVCDRHGERRRSRRIRSPGEDSAELERPTDIERDAVGRAARTRAPAKVGPVSAWPIERDGWLRVISLADAGELLSTIRSR